MTENKHPQFLILQYIYSTIYLSIHLFYYIFGGKALHFCYSSLHLSFRQPHFQGDGDDSTQWDESKTPCRLLLAFCVSLLSIQAAS